MATAQSNTTPYFREEQLIILQELEKVYGKLPDTLLEFFAREYRDNPQFAIPEEFLLRVKTDVVKYKMGILDMNPEKDIYALQDKYNALQERYLDMEEDLDVAESTSEIMMDFIKKKGLARELAVFYYREIGFTDKEIAEMDDLDDFDITE